MALGRAIRAGRAFVELFADTRRLKRGLRRAEWRIRAFGEKVKNMGASLVRMGTMMAAPMALATKVFAGFDDQMRAVQAVMGTTGEAFEMLTEKAKLLGRTTSYTAAQVAGGMLELARAGFDAQQVNAAIGDVLALARATGTDLAMSANIAASTLRAFNLEADDMGHVADVMTAAANNSAQTLEDLSEAMKYAAPVAESYGLSLEETTKILGSLANFSIRGSMAGNVMKNIMLQLADSGVRKKLEDLGVATTDAAGNMLEVSAILRNVGKAIRDMPKADQLSIMNELFGRRAVAGGIKLTTANFERLADAIDNAEGVAERTADIMDSGIGGAMRRLWSAIEGVAIAIGDGLAPTLSGVAEWLSTVAGHITAWIQRNKELVSVLGKATIVVLAAGAALLTLGVAVKGLTLAISLLSPAVMAASAAISALKVAIAVLVSPIGLVIAAFAALTGYILHATGVLAKALEWLGGKFGVLKEDALAALDGIGAALAAGEIGLAMRVLWQTLKMEWTRGVNFLEKAWLNFRNFFIRIGYDAWHGLLVIAETIWHGLEVGWIETTAFFAKAWANFTGFFAKTWERIKGGAKKAWNWIKSLFDDSVDLEAENAKVEAEKQAAISRIENEQDRKIAEREAQRQRERRRADAVHRRVLDDIGRENLDKHRQLDQEYARKMAENEADLARARDEWKRAIQDARDKKKDRTADGGPEGPGDPDDAVKKAQDVLKNLGNVGSLINRETAKIGVSGGFVAANLLGFQTGGPMDRVANGIEKIEKNTRPIRDGDGPAFE